ncbi:LytR/AlgR family response regulator transcription factor [Tenacibaculum xiamenense]|uniref:LytR/AlgR family response regulator transcription factor n=1 Tax=Tenacibaculum xiamenense TaxID=1261553 RepID=UPI003894137D
MNRVFSRLTNLKKLNSFNPKLKSFLLLIVISTIANHLAQSENFPFHSYYSFPYVSIIVSTIIGITVLAIAKYNFIFFEKNYFHKEITVKTLTYFLASTLLYISLAYLPIYWIVVSLRDGDFELYYFSTGLSITLLLSGLAIIFMFAEAIYKLHKLETIHGTLNFKKAGETCLIKLNEIALLYSENKIVYIVNTDGKIITTDFTLNSANEQLNNHSFFRANRQTILHFNSIEKLKPVENGKLSVLLKSSIIDGENREIMISRYKKKDFENWFHNKL